MGVKRCAYITLATNDIYAKSALVLAKTLRNTNTTLPIYLLLSQQNTVSTPLQGLLKQSFDKVITVDTLIADNTGYYPRPELAVTLTKLHAFNLDDVDLFCFLDADTMVRANIDHVFETEAQFSACPDFGWPDCFNSGFFVAKPSKQVYSELVSHTKQPDPSFDGGDQGLLNSYFASNWQRLSVLYNMPISHIAPTADSPNYGGFSGFKQFGKDTKVVHFIGGGDNKPWSSSTTSETVSYFKHMWNQILREEMSKLIHFPAAPPVTSMSQPVEKKEEPQHAPPQFASQVPQPRQPVSFDEIWQHLQSQFKK